MESTEEDVFMNGKPLVLVAARERAVRGVVAAALKPAGFRIAASESDEPSADEIEDHRPDVVVMDAREPATATFDAIGRIARDASTPLLLLSSRATPARVVHGLDAGADDYLARPFDPAELSARVRSLVRRRRGRLGAGCYRVGSSVVDLDSRRITRDGRSIGLTRPEWTLLALLLHNEGRLLMREELLAAAFGASYHDNAAQLRLAISALRRKLGLAPWDEGPIRTIHGLGYAFDPKGRLRRSWSGRRGSVAEDPPPNAA
jgi:DNA-binding response OmpR family regulator